MKYITPMQICKTNAADCYDYISNNPDLCIFSCWCVNLTDTTPFENLSNTLVIPNTLEVLHDRESILCQNLLYKHLVWLLSIYKDVAILTDATSFPSANKPITFIDSNNVLIHKKEETYTFFKRLERYVSLEVGLYTELSQSYRSILKQFDEVSLYKLI